MNKIEEKHVNGLTELASLIHKNNVEKGFWDAPLNVPERLMLTVSELAEAMEADRKDHMADLSGFDTLHSSGADFKKNFETNIKNSYEDELADVIIRVLDLAAGQNIDIAAHIMYKVNYNTGRPFKHGKKY